MNYTDEQKRIIQSINENRINNIYDLLQVDKKFIIEKYKGNIGRQKTLEVGEKIFIISKEEEIEVLNRLANIINLCIFLNDKKLIYILDIGYNYVNIPFYSKNELGMQTTVEELNRIIQEYTKKLYITTPALDEFIYNKYKTNEEIEIINERKGRQKAEKRTIMVAVISVIISFLICISSIFFNFLTYKKEQNIIINYPNELNYSLEVLDIDSILLRLKEKNNDLKPVIEFIKENE